MFLGFLVPMMETGSQTKGEKNMKEQFSLPEDQCERLVRVEMQAVRMMLATLSTAAYAKDDLKKRLECVPYGNERMRMALGGLRSVINDLIGTISVQQAKQIYGTMKDFEMRLVPKLTPASTNVILTKEQAKDLMDCARWQCHDCVNSGEEARGCRLYKLLESTTPADDYGDGMVCPYALAEWKD